MDVPVKYINQALGLGLGSDEIQKLLAKMQLEGSVSADSSSISVRVPPTRSDVLHACDVMEDVAIAFGYNNIPKKVRQIGSCWCIMPCQHWHAHIAGDGAGGVGVETGLEGA